MINFDDLHLSFTDIPQWVTLIICIFNLYKFYDNVPRIYW